MIKIIFNQDNNNNHGRDTFLVPYYQDIRLQYFISFLQINDKLLVTADLKERVQKLHQRLLSQLNYSILQYFQLQIAMATFNPNQTVLAYARLGKSQGKTKINHKNLNIIKPSKSQERNSTGNLYQAIMGEMATQHHRYINQLINRNQKNQNSQLQSQPTLGHERAKSYADIMIQNATQHNISAQNSQQLFTQSKLSYRGSKQSFKKKKDNQRNQIQSQQSPSTFYKSTDEQLGQTNQSNHTNINNQIGFLDELDSYIDNLNRIQSKNESNFYSKNDINFENKKSQQRKNRKLIEIQNVAIINKLDWQDKKIKELKIKNQLLKIQQSKHLKKQKIMKNKLYQMLDHIKVLNSELDRERKEKKNMEFLFLDVQNKFNRLKPQRKTMGHRPTHKYEDYLHFDITENQSDKNSELDCFLATHTYKTHSKIRKQFSGSKNHSKINKNIMTEEEIQDLFGHKEDDSEESSSNH